MGVRLPAEYQEVEYLESTGTQYIDTGFSPTIETEVVVDFSDFNNNGNTYATPFGLAINGSHVGVYKQNNNGTVYTSFGSGVDVTYITSYGWANRLVISQSKNCCYENGTRVVSAYENLTFTETSRHIFIFARSDSEGTAARFVIYKLYKLQINDNTIQVRNYIPCYRKYDSKPGMYDLVSETFFINQGTGEFLVGPDVKYGLPYEYQEVEYLEATGTQAFFTDVPIQDGLTVDSIQTFNGGDTYLFGGHNGKGLQASFNGQYAGQVQSSYSGYYFFGNVNNGNNTIYHIVLTQKNGEQIGVLNGSQVLSGTHATSGDTSAGATAALFGQRGSSGELGLFYKGRLYRCKVSKDGIQLADYVPCYRRSDNKPGMYDFVSGTFYTNQGEGEFLVGPVIHRIISPRLMDRRRALIAKLTSLFRKVITSQTGLVSFDTNVAKPMKVTCEFSPKQDLHGQDSPYPAGGGKNLFNKDAAPYISGEYISSVVTGNSISTSANSNYNIYQIPVNEGAQYTFGPLYANQPCWAFVDAQGNVVYGGSNSGGTTGQSCTWTAPVGSVALLLSVAVADSYKFDDVLQVELGSSATSYAPYENICPIEGWDGANIVSSKKNLTPPLSDESFWDYDGYIGSQQGDLIVSQSYKACSKYCPAVAGADYIFHANGAWRGIAFYDAHKIKVGFAEKNELVVSAKAPSTAAYYRVYVSKNCDNIQLELSDIATTYEEYTANTISIPFNNPGTYDFLPIQAGTGDPSPENVRPITPGLTLTRDDNTTLEVWGGSLTVNADGTGSLVGTMTVGEIVDVAGRIEKSAGYYWYTTTGSVGIVPIKADNSGLVIDRLISEYNVSETTNEGHISFYSNGILRWKEHGDMSLADYKTYLQNNPFHIAYEVLEPTTYTLSVAETSRAFEALGLGKNLGPLYSGSVTINEDGSCDVVSEWGNAVLGNLTVGAFESNEICSSGRFQLPLQTSYGDSAYYCPSITSFTATQASQYMGYYVSRMQNHLAGNANKVTVYAIDTGYVVVGTKNCQNVSQADFTAYVSGWEVAYKLAAPQTYHFSSISELQSFLGTNNIWSDLNGPITVEYYKKQQ